MKLSNKSISLIMAVIIALSTIVIAPIGASAVETDVAGTGAESGITGDCTWTLNGTVLTISGNGYMEDYRSPWKYNITQVVIKNGVKSIGAKAFYGCDFLTSVSIPNSVKTIGANAFEGCERLTNVIIPDSVHGIGVAAFCGCTGLTNISIPKSVTTIVSGTFRNCRSLASVTIPNSVTSIGKEAFNNCKSLKSIAIPNSVKNLGVGVFSGCEKLKNVYIPNTVTSIGSYAFEDCVSLTSITIPETVSRISNHQFSNCKNLINMVIPNSVTSIEANAFCSCTGLTSITIPNSVKSIGERSFEYCKRLTSLCIPNSVKSVGEDAFYGCTNLKSVTISNSVNILRSYLFSHCTSLEIVNIPNSVTSIEAYAFRGCTGLKNITIPNSVKSIGEGAFIDCPKIKKVTVPAYVKEFGAQSFGYYDQDYSNGRLSAKKTAGFTLCGYENTAAESYAKKNGFKFVALDNLKTPKLTAVQNAVSGVNIKWGKITNATKYRIFRKTGSGKWIKLGDTTKTSYTDKTAKSGTKYAYTVRCVSKDGKKYTSNYDKKGKSIVYYAAPKLTKIANGRKGVDLTWKKVTGAGAYRVYRCDGKTKKWKSIGTTTAVTFTDKTAKSGKAYSYTVRCLAKDKKTLISAYDPKGKYTKFLSSPIMNDIYSTNTGVCVTWKKVAGAEKYRILRRGGKTSGWTELGDTSGSYFIDRSAKNKTKYQYTVRCVSKDGKKYTSSWKTVGTIIYKR